MQLLQFPFCFAGVVARDTMGRVAAGELVLDVYAHIFGLEGFFFTSFTVFLDWEGGMQILRSVALEMWMVA